MGLCKVNKISTLIANYNHVKIDTFTSLNSQSFNQTSQIKVRSLFLIAWFRQFTSNLL